MLREIEPDHWHKFLDEFGERNRRRDARLQISGQIGAPRVERDLPLDGITIKEAVCELCLRVPVVNSHSRLNPCANCFKFDYAPIHACFVPVRDKNDAIVPTPPPGYSPAPNPSGGALTSGTLKR
jgi:hypothetical protein